VTSTTRYVHIQFAVINLILLIALLLPLTFYAAGFGAASMILPGLVLVAGLIWFTTFTVVVTADHLECQFGPGLLRKRIALAEVEGVSQVKTSFWETGGWGIRTIPGGSAWILSGFSTVELRLHGGATFRVGTNKPDELEAALLARIPGAG
jgi:hypothetical protein